MHTSHTIKHKYGSVEESWWCLAGTMTLGRWMQKYEFRVIFSYSMSSGPA